jgi:hypothetical protein
MQGYINNSEEVWESQFQEVVNLVSGFKSYRRFTAKTDNVVYFQNRTEDVCKCRTHILSADMLKNLNKHISSADMP